MNEDIYASEHWSKIYHVLDQRESEREKDASLCGLEFHIMRWQNAKPLGKRICLRCKKGQGQ